MEVLYAIPLVPLQERLTEKFHALLGLFLDFRLSPTTIGAIADQTADEMDARLRENLDVRKEFQNAKYAVAAIEKKEEWGGFVVRVFA
jgi:hypothetical protein